MSVQEGGHLLYFKIRDEMKATAVWFPRVAITLAMTAVWPQAVVVYADTDCVCGCADFVDMTRRIADFVVRR